MFGTGPLFYYMEQGKKNCAPNGYAKADRPLLIVGTALGAVPTGSCKFFALLKTIFPLSALVKTGKDTEPSSVLRASFTHCRGCAEMNRAPL